MDEERRKTGTRKTGSKVYRPLSRWTPPTHSPSLRQDRNRKSPSSRLLPPSRLPYEHVRLDDDDDDDGTDGSRLPTRALVLLFSDDGGASYFLDYQPAPPTTAATPTERRRDQRVSSRAHEKVRRTLARTHALVGPTDRLADWEWCRCRWCRWWRQHA